MTIRHALPLFLALGAGCDPNDDSNADNRPPVPDDIEVMTDQQTPIGIELTAADPDGDPLLFLVVDQPSSGELSGEAPLLTYTPNPTLSGTDVFTFVANDGEFESELGTVTVQISASANQPPSVEDVDVETDEDVPVDITLSGTDPENAPVTISLVTQPTHGVIEGSGANLTYVPDHNANGIDKFSYRASDGLDASPTSVVTITVHPVNDAPKTQDETYVLPEGSTFTTDLRFEDPDGDSVTLKMGDLPQHGTLVGNGPFLDYTPDAGFVGTDHFTFRVTDGILDSDLAVVTFIVEAVNEAPVARDSDEVTTEDTPLEFSVMATDVNKDTLLYQIIDVPAHGDIVGPPPDLTYLAEANWHGVDSFTFIANDGTVDSNLGIVTITVQSENDRPNATPQSIELDEDASIDITLTGTDVDGDALTPELETVATHGELIELDPSTWTYTPASDYAGADAFTFRVFDGDIFSAAATVDINVLPVNDLPLAVDQQITTNQDTFIDVTLSAIDGDGDPLTFSIATHPTQGSLVTTFPVVRYTPDPGVFGQDSFTFTASDASATSTPATITIDIIESNEIPVAAGASYIVDEDDTVPITLVATDDDGDNLTYAIVVAPANGTINGTPPDITYTPFTDYFGEDSFRFEAYDHLAASSSALVNLTVQPLPDAPVIESVTLSPSEPSTVDTVTATVTTVDPDGDLIFTHSYDWYVGVTTTGETGATLDGAFFEKDDLVYAIAIATDSTGLTSLPVISEIVTIANTIPGTAVGTIAPSYPATGSELICIIVTPAEDVDNDVLTYAFTWEVNGLPYPTSADTGAGWPGPAETTVHTGDTIPASDVHVGDEWVCNIAANDGTSDGLAFTTAAVTIGEAGVCGNDIVDAGEEYDPPPGPFIHAEVDAADCRWDFSSITQLYCEAICSNAGELGCDQADADALCRLITGNAASAATDFEVTTALDEPGFGCAVLPNFGVTIEVDRGVSAPISFVDGSLLDDHGAGLVVANPTFTNP